MFERPVRTAEDGKGARMETAGGCHLAGQWMGQQDSISSEASAETDVPFGLPGLARRR